MSFKILFFPLLVALFQGTSQPVAVRKSAAPQPEVLDGYNRGHCISLPHQVRVCKQLSDEHDVLLVEKNGKQVSIWPAEADFGETEGFEVLQTDLDHDGHAELIVANHDGTSNGLGIDYWTISIFPDAAFRTLAEPLTFSVEEYGSLGTFVANRRGVSILTTRWVWTKDPKRKRDVGLYLVGHWWRYQSGELVPQIDLVPVARRYLFSFAYERGDTGSSDRVPYRWFRNARAETLKPEQITGASSKTQTGTIENVSALTTTGSQRTVKITFRVNGETPVVYTYPGDRNEDNELDLDFLGDAASGRIFPIRYLPPRIDSWLKGKRATLRVYGDEPRAEKILWLER